MWDVNGVQGAGDPPPISNQFKGDLLIIGGGRGLWEDVGKVRPWTGDVMAVNDVGAYYRQTLNHWATLHPEYMPGWHFYRMKHNYGNRGHVYTHSNKPHRDIQFDWNLANIGGTSGLFACQVGLALGYKRIILAGIHCDNSGHFFDPPWVMTNLDDGAVAEVWKWARDNVFKGRVKSLSGNTRKWLGEP